MGAVATIGQRIGAAIPNSAGGSNRPRNVYQTNEGAALLPIRSKTQSNKGRAFENFIEATNRHYSAAGIAVIQKIPTPTANIKGRIVYHQKSTVDFMGSARGVAVAFEAKETVGTKRPDGTRRPESSFPLYSHDKMMISEHQIRYLEKFEKTGAWAFVLIRFRVRGDVYRIPVGIIREWYREARRNGKKSVPISEFMAEWKTDPNDYLKLLS